MAEVDNRAAQEIENADNDVSSVISDADNDASIVNIYADNDASTINRNADNDASAADAVGGADSDASGLCTDRETDNDASNRDTDIDASADSREGDNDASDLDILYTNAQSLVNKIEELRAIIAINNPDVTIITETWTHEAISNEYLNVNGYDIIERQDRNDTDKGRGGGIIIYVRKTLYAWREECETVFNQCGAIKIKTNKGDVCFLAVYRSPNSVKANDDELCKHIESMSGTYVIFGDFNFPDIRWQTGCAGTKGRRFLETIHNKFLTQHIESATHNSGNILDLIISSDDDLVRNVETCGKIGKSDHDLIKCIVHVGALKSKVSKRSRNFRKARQDEMRREMRKDWSKMMEGKSVNEAWQILKESLEKVIDEYVPMRRMKRKDEPQWLDTEMRNTISEKRRAWANWKRTGRETEREVYARKERECKRMIRNKKNALERSIAKNRKSNPKMYFSYVNSAKKNRSRLGPLKNEKGEFIIDPKEQAETMSNFFKSVFTCSDGDPPTKEPVHGNRTLNVIEVTEERVKSLIDGMRENSAPGPDGIPPIVLKILRDEVAFPLAILFKKSLEDGRIPDEWRDAHVTAIHKKGSRAEPGNYRGVSLTSVVGKLLERTVKHELDAHIENNGLIEDSQHGFRRGRSTATNLIEFLNVTTGWNDNGNCFDVIYLDFSKAFDVVCHKRLLVKLEAIGVGGNVIKWIQDWISKRRQRVVVDGKFSEWADVVSSVIQGSVLGGILFDIFVGDIDDAILIAIIKKFADDTKLAMRIKNAEDARQMQENLDRICGWAERWKMSFNAKKCKVMHFGRQNIRYGYTMNGVAIEEVKEEKDLGVWMEEDLRPSKQCQVAAQSANWALGQLSRAFHFRKASCIVPLYKTFVRPKLEHAVTAWSPWTEGDRETLEKVQRRLIRLISDKKGDSYEERLDSVGLTTLVERRDRGDMIETFRTIQGVNRVDRTNWFQFRDSTNTRATRATVSVTDGEQNRRENVLFMGNVRLDTRKNFFTVRVISRWNNIPDEVRNAKTVNGFKDKYDEWVKKRKQQQQQQQQLQT